MNYSIKRNNYFLGKLLTSEDCKLEQEYFNYKRQLINKYYFGRGIVYGLTVSAEKGISGFLTISPGLAIDSKGKEIVVFSEQKLNLNSITNFQSGQDSEQRAAYLCLEYCQKLDEPTVSAFTINQEEDNFNHIKEYYRVYLDYGDDFSNNADLEEILKGEYYFWNKNIICDDEKFIMSVKIPKYIMTDGLLKCELEIEKLVNLQDKISVSCSVKILKNEEDTVDTENIGDTKAKELCKFNFNEDDNTSLMFYNISQLCFVPDSSIDKKGKLSVMIQVDEIRLGQDTITVSPIAKNQDIQLVSDIESELRKQYFLNFNKDSDKYKIYLAKVFYKLDKENYEIIDIMNLPFNQCVKKGRLANILENIDINRVQLIKFLENNFQEKISVVNEEINKKINDVNEEINKEINDVNKNIKSINTKLNNVEKISCDVESMKKLFKCVQEKLSQNSAFNYGICKISIGNDLSIPSQSESINHRLGSGDVQIYCEIIQEDANKNLFRGPNGVFGSDMEMPVFDIGTKLDKEKGEFTIYLKTNNTQLVKPTVKLAWYVYKNRFKENLADDFLVIEPSFTLIQPDTATAPLKFNILSSFKNLDDIKPTVNPDKGKIEIDSSNFTLSYEVPSEENLYEINVKCGEISANAFVYVTK